MESSSPVVPQLAPTVTGSTSDLTTTSMGPSPGQQQLTETATNSAVIEINTSIGAVNDPYNSLNCETTNTMNIFNQNQTQLLNSLIADNNYKPQSETNTFIDRPPTELTFSDLTPPVPNVSSLESNLQVLGSVAGDPSQPTFDGVSGAVPAEQTVQQMTSINTESPQIEIPITETIIPSIAPNNDIQQSSAAQHQLMDSVNDSQYSNIFQPVINGPSGSAPQTPAASPIEVNEPQQSVINTSNSAVNQMTNLSSFGSNSTNTTNNFVNTTVSTDLFNVPMNSMVPVLNNNNNNTVVSQRPTDGPLPALGLERALQEQLLDAIPPPSVNFPPGPVPMDEKGIPSALPGEFPLSLLPVEEDKTGGIGLVSVSLDKIEATINMNSKSSATVTNAVALSQSQVNIIHSLQHPIPAQQQSIAITATTNCLDNRPQQQQGFNLNYTNQLTVATTPLVDQTVYSSTTIDVQPSSTSIQTSQDQQQPIVTPHSQSMPQNIEALQPLQPQQHQQQQPSQQILTPESTVQQAVVSTSLGNVPEVQLPPAPAPPSATSITVFESSPNDLMPEMVSQNQLSNGLPPPPPLQPVQNINQTVLTPMTEMNTLTNLVPVVEPTDPSIHLQQQRHQQQSCSQPLSIVIKSEPQSYNEQQVVVNNTTISNNNNNNNNNNNTSEQLLGISKVNDNNNNPILNNRESKPLNMLNNARTQAMANSQVRSFPLCVISATPTTFSASKSNTSFGAHNLPLPPKKAKLTVSGVPQAVVSLSSKAPQMSAVPSTAMIYDLPLHQTQHPFTTATTFRVQPELTQTSKLQHNMTPTFTTVAPILLSGLTLDGPLSLVKSEDKMRQLAATTSIANHPDYPAISGLLSFINPIHRQTNSSVTTCIETPLSLNVKSNLTSAPIVANSLIHSHSVAHTSHVPSLTRPSQHHNQSITSATIVSTSPTAVPVSVVTSVADQTRGALQQRIKSIGQSNNKNRVNLENTSGSSGMKLQLAPLLSGDPAKPFQCSLCGKHLASKNVYQLHLRSHSGEKPFTCNLCGHSFSQKTSLTRHMRSHTGERPFPCQICGKRFADKERIKIHMRTHTGEKPFSCEVCGKQFSQKSTVKRHMSVHTGEKPYKCEACGKGFANRGNLTAHTKTHSNS